MEPDIFYPFEIYLLDKKTKIGRFLECKLNIINEEEVEWQFGNGIINKRYKYLFESEQANLFAEVGDKKNEWFEITSVTDININRVPGRRWHVVNWKGIGKNNFLTNGTNI